MVACNFMSSSSRAVYLNPVWPMLIVRSQSTLTQWCAGSAWLWNTVFYVPSLTGTKLAALMQYSYSPQPFNLFAPTAIKTILIEHWSILKHKQHIRIMWKQVWYIWTLAQKLYQICINDPCIACFIVSTCILLRNSIYNLVYVLVIFRNVCFWYLSTHPVRLGKTCVLIAVHIRHTRSAVFFEHVQNVISQNRLYLHLVFPDVCVKGIPLVTFNI